MIRLPPRATLTDTLLSYTTLFLSSRVQPNNFVMMLRVVSCCHLANLLNWLLQGRPRKVTQISSLLHSPLNGSSAGRWYHTGFFGAAALAKIFDKDLQLTSGPSGFRHVPPRVKIRREPGRER